MMWPILVIDQPCQFFKIGNDGVRACAPGLRIYRSDMHVLATVRGPEVGGSYVCVRLSPHGNEPQDAHYVADISLDEWRNMIEAEAIAFGLIAPKNEVSK